MMKNRGVGIFSTGSYIPKKILTNFDLEKMVDTSDKWIFEKIGIKERHLADSSEATSDLACKAAKQAMQMGGVKTLEIDLIIVATCTPDMFSPSTACIVQSKLKAKNAVCFDINAACSGFNYALDIGVKYIQDGTFNAGLIICAETIASHGTDWSDRDSCIYFGDGAGAVILKPVSSNKGILVSYLLSDGSRGDAIGGYAVGSKYGITSETARDKLHCIKINGKKVWRFAIKAFPEAVNGVLKKGKVAIEDIDFIISHQANINLIKYGMKKLGLPMAKTYTNIDRYGNTGGPSVAIALDEAVRLKKIKKNDLVVLVGFGSGLTWGANLIRWNGKEDFIQ
jgi:3-oxoacyl-[acyl-carrier-protein] synthase-3